jgi:hypothetical protein
MNFQSLNQFKQSRKLKRNLFKFLGLWAEFAHVAQLTLARDLPGPRPTMAVSPWLAVARGLPS